MRPLVRGFQEHMARYGYALIDLPVIEAADLFLIKAGDQVIEKLFTFERHGQQFALRPEFTAAAAYRYIHQDAAQPQIVRWQFNGVVFEDDPIHAAQNYQQMSVGAELIGMAGTAAEAEVISMAAAGVAMLQPASWRIHIGHMKLIRQVIARFRLDSRTERFVLHHLPALRDPLKGKAYVIEQLDKLLLGQPQVTAANALDTFQPEKDNDTNDTLGQPNTQQMLDMLLETTRRGATMGGRTHHDIARRLLQKRIRAAERGQIIEALDVLERWSSISHTPDEAFTRIDALLEPGETDARMTLAEWQTVVKLLEAYDISTERLIIQPDLARSWAYYTGIVFDLVTDTGLLLGGGGRYDELGRLIGGRQDVPAVGFAYYLDSILEIAALPENQQFRSVVIVTTLANAFAAANWAHRLRLLRLDVCLLPPEHISPQDVVVTVDERGQAVLHGSTYSLSEADRLVQALG